jgi:hypothetical protein
MHLLVVVVVIVIVIVIAASWEFSAGIWLGWNRC